MRYVVVPNCGMVSHKINLRDFWDMLQRDRDFPIQTECLQEPVRSNGHLLSQTTQTCSVLLVMSSLFGFFVRSGTEAILTRRAK